MFKLGDKVVFTGKDSIELSDFGVVVDFFQHDDGSTSPIVRFNGDSSDSYPIPKYLEVVSHFSIKIEPKDFTLNEQTFMLWTLQLQFMNMSVSSLDIIYRQVFGKYMLDYDHEKAATELALYLSGLK